MVIISDGIRRDKRRTQNKSPNENSERQTPLATDGSNPTPGSVANIKRQACLKFCAGQRLVFRIALLS